MKSTFKLHNNLILFRGYGYTFTIHVEHVDIIIQALIEFMATNNFTNTYISNIQKHSEVYTRTTYSISILRNKSFFIFEKGEIPSIIGKLIDLKVQRELVV